MAPTKNLFLCLYIISISGFVLGSRKDYCHQSSIHDHYDQQYLTDSLSDTRWCSCAVACDTIAFQLGIMVHYPETDNFTVWDAKQQEARPVCRVEPSSTADVASIMNILVENWCTFAVKSGGHSHIRGSSNSIRGITIDLGKLNTVELLENDTRAKIGAGATWGNVFAILEKSGLAVPGGRLSDIGVGGFTLGGGISYLSPKYGLACDSVIEYEVILPNATTTTANQYQHPDLYFALRGGGNNFGIVTSFTFQTYPQKRLWGGTLVFDESVTEQVTDATFELLTKHSNDHNLAYWHCFVYLQKNDIMISSVQPMYAEPIETPEVFSKLLSIPSLMSHTRIDWMSNFTYELGVQSPFGVRNQYSTLSFIPSKDLEMDIISIFKEELQTVKLVNGILPIMNFQPLGKNALARMKERGGNAIGLDMDGPLTICHTNTLWLDSTNDDTVDRFIRRFIEGATKAAIQRGLYHPYIYMNYASAAQDIYAGYNSQNVARLKEIQKAVDPRGIFTSKGLCNVYFKLI